MKPRILIVDDEPSVVEVLNQHLTAEGNECSGTTSPIEALGWLREGAYDALLADIIMPQMSGLELVRQAREIDPELAVVVITCVTDVNKAIEAIRTGAEDYVLKPFNLSEISGAVSKALEKRGRAVERKQRQQALESRIREATEDLERVNRELRTTKEYLENLLHSTVDGIFTVDMSGCIDFVNDGVLQMLGYERAELLGAHLSLLCAGGADEVTYVRRLLDEGKPIQNYESELRRKDNELIPAIMSLSLVRNADGRVDSILAVCKDVTEQKRLERQLKEMSIKDSLTGLYNHRYFFDRLQAEMERARRQQHPLSLLLLDIDKFKTYNDSRGHLEGDEVLQRVGRVLRECTRDHVDLGFRYGGDEFTVILPEADEEQALLIAERIRNGFEVEHYDKLTLSIGLMAYSAGVSLRSFVQFADMMMYNAKRGGGNQVFVHRPDPSEVVEDATKDEEA